MVCRCGVREVAGLPCGVVTTFAAPGHGAPGPPLLATPSDAFRRRLREAGKKGSTGTAGRASSPRWRVLLLVTERAHALMLFRVLKRVSATFFCSTLDSLPQRRGYCSLLCLSRCSFGSSLLRLLRVLDKAGARYTQATFCNRTAITSPSIHTYEEIRGGVTSSLIIFITIRYVGARVGEEIVVNYKYGELHPSQTQKGKGSLFKAVEIISS